MSEDHVLLNVL